MSLFVQGVELSSDIGVKLPSGVGVKLLGGVGVNLPGRRGMSRLDAGGIIGNLLEKESE